MTSTPLSVHPNRVIEGSVLMDAQPMTGHKLTPPEILRLDRLARQIHGRRESTRAVPHVSEDYAAGSRLTTRAYMARALETLVARPESDVFESASTPLGPDADLGPNWPCPSLPHIIGCYRCAMPILTKKHAVQLSLCLRFIFVLLP